MFMIDPHRRSYVRAQPLGVVRDAIETQVAHTFEKKKGCLVMTLNQTGKQSDPHLPKPIFRFLQQPHSDSQRRTLITRSNSKTVDPTAATVV